MPIPEKKEDLLAAGWIFDNEAFCRGCGEPIEWWIMPNGRKMPMSVVELKKDKNFFAPARELVRRSHFITCPEAASFRKDR